MERAKKVMNCAVWSGEHISYITLHWPEDDLAVAWPKIMVISGHSCRKDQIDTMLQEKGSTFWTAHQSEKTGHLRV